MTMKKLTTLCLIMATAVFCLTSCNLLEKKPGTPSTVTNPLPMKLGDPFLLHASNGRYYMYGTSMADGFEAFVSDDLVNWESCGQVYHGGDSNQWCKDCFWAPEVYERNGKYYMFFSANWRKNPTNEAENFKIGVAVSERPEGPFRDLMNRPIFNPEYPIIDANVFFDDTHNRCYLYYSRCCYKHPVESEVADSLRREGVYKEIEESWVYGIEMKNDFTGVIGEPVLLLQPPTSMSDKQAEWESRSASHGEANRRWTEGSFILQHNGLYYMMYSANCYQGKYYAVGYATACNPLGPFFKADNNPVLQENLQQGGEVMGTGHNMAIKMPDGTYYTVYHGRMKSNPDERVVLMDRMRIEDSGKLIVDGPTTEPQVIRR